jgi:type I restriction enzyme M protein
LAKVEPHLADAWGDTDTIKTAYEINFNSYFYDIRMAYEMNFNRYYDRTPPRPLTEIDAEIKQNEEKMIKLLQEVTG